MPARNASTGTDNNAGLEGLVVVDAIVAEPAEKVGVGMAGGMGDMGGMPSATVAWSNY